MPLPPTFPPLLFPAALLFYGVTIIKEIKVVMDKKDPQTNCIRLYRRKLGLTQSEAARLIGLKTASPLSHFERSDKLPSLKNAIKLEIALHAPVAFLFRDLYDQSRREIRDRAEKAPARR